MMAKMVMTMARPRKGPRVRSHCPTTDFRVSFEMAGADAIAGVFIAGIPFLRRQE